MINRKLIILAIVLFSGLSFSKNTALVIIDMQPYFSEKETYDENNSRKLAKVLSRQLALIRISKKNHLPIVIIEYHPRGIREEEHVLNKENDPRNRTNSLILDEIGYYEQVKYISKSWDGVFDDELASDELIAYLNSKDVSKLLVAGANGGACVRCSIEGALKEGFNVLIDNLGVIDFNFSEFVLPYEYTDTNLISSKKFYQTSDLNEVDQFISKEGNANFLKKTKICIEKIEKLFF